MSAANPANIIIRYADQGGRPIDARRRGDRIRIDSVDGGIGITADELTHIFEAFYQVAKSSTIARGFGKLSHD